VQDERPVAAAILALCTVRVAKRDAVEPDVQRSGGQRRGRGLLHARRQQQQLADPVDAGGRLL